MKRPNLTKCQQRVFDALAEHMHQFGCVPTHEELALNLDLARSTVSHHLSVIEEKGYMRRSRRWHDTQLLSAREGAKAAAKFRKKGAKK